MSKTNFDEEFESLQLDRPASGKTPQQLQKHSLEAVYDNKPVERSLYILSKGDDLQKLSVIQNLPNLLVADHNGTVSRIIPKIQQELPVNSSIEFHLVTSKMFMVLFEMQLGLNLLRAVLQGIESKDPMVASAWNETLLEVIPFLSEPAVKEEVLPFALKHCQLNRPVFYRVNSCKLLGKICSFPKINSFDVKRDVIPTTQSLCQDCLYEVRAAMCIELPNVAKGLDNEGNVKTCLLPCLVELSSDENIQVRKAAIEAAIELVQYLNPETVKQTAIPLLKRMCLISLSEGDETYSIVAKHFGQMLTNLQLHLSDVDCVWFLEHFNELSKKGISIINEDLESDPALAVQCREFCANNLPLVVFFVLTQVKEELSKWYIVFKDLAADPCFIVRKSVASKIHEIVRTLGIDGKLVIPDFLKLIRDDSEEVLDTLVQHIGPTLTLLSNIGCLGKDQTSQITLDTGRALLKYETEIFKYHNWRRKRMFLQQLETLPNCMPADFIHQNFTPLILRLTIQSGARPIRTQAARTLLIFLRYNMKENHRKWIRESLINGLCFSKCSYTRHIYIKMCIEAMKIFSWKYFKEYFYSPLVGLGEDPVSTVRLCVVNLSPLLKQMLVLPIDRILQNKLDNMVSRLEMIEQDKDVLAILKEKLKEMRSIHGVKQEILLDEKRKIEEEDRILQGKTGLAQRDSSFNKNIGASHQQRLLNIARERPSNGSAGNRSSTGSGNNIMRSSNTQPPNFRGSNQQSLPQRNNQMNLDKDKPSLPNNRIASRTSNISSAPNASFLDQHFYIDAGIVLPESVTSAPLKSLEDEMSHLNLQSVVSTEYLEKANIENMSDDDIIGLKTSTTNITDDVKVDIEKKNVNYDRIKKRNKRNSCFFTRDLSKEVHLKRRSLNIANECSKIPVIQKTYIGSDRIKLNSKKTNEDNKDKKTDANISKSVKNSHLPILIRQPRMNK